MSTLKIGIATSFSGETKTATKLTAQKTKPTSKPVLAKVGFVFVAAYGRPVVMA